MFPNYDKESITIFNYELEALDEFEELDEFEALATSRFRFMKGSSSPKIPDAETEAEDSEEDSDEEFAPKVGGAVRGFAAPMRSRFMDS